MKIKISILSIIFISLFGCSFYKMNLNTYTPDKFLNSGKNLFQVTLINNSDIDYHQIMFQTNDSTDEVKFSDYLRLCKGCCYSPIYDSTKFDEIKVHLIPASKTKGTEINKTYTLKELKQLNFIISVGTPIKSFEILNDTGMVMFLHPKKGYLKQPVKSTTKKDSLIIREIRSFTTSFPRVYYQKRFDLYGTLREEGQSTSYNHIWNGNEVSLAESGLWTIYDSNGNFVEYTIFDMPF